MEWLFPTPPTADQRFKNAIKQLRNAEAELKRQRTRLAGDEPKIKRELKAAAQKGEMEIAKMMCQNLVRKRNAATRFYKMEVQLQGQRANLHVGKATGAMQKVMRDTTRILYRMNKQCPLPKLQKVVKEWEKQNELMDMRQELMDDAIDDALEGDDDEEKEAAAIAEIMEEIGIETADTMVGVKRKEPEVRNNLTKRINDLKK